MTVSIIVPIFNEAESLAELFDELCSACLDIQPFEVVCIDDGSTDETLDVLMHEMTKHPEIRVIKFKNNVGKSDALDAGFKAAKGEIIVTIDADLQNPPAEIPRLVKALEDCDCVIGWRADRRDTIFKRFASTVANGIRGGLLKDNSHDSACALKAFKRQYLMEVVMYKGMHRFLPALLITQGALVREIRVQDRNRRYGSSKYGTFARGIPGLFDLLAVRWMQKRRLTYEIESITRHG
ncbi:MAG: glycosyltransferase family 2 protein [Gammaproteobacteria bacterium]|nr:glycosyltransferase family 2 protein [Gammaproteobacteria bacterium]